MGEAASGLNQRIAERVRSAPREGAIDIILGAERHRLHKSYCLVMQLDRPTMFHNPTRKPRAMRR